MMTGYPDLTTPLVRFIQPYELTHLHIRTELKHEPAWTGRRFPTVDPRHLTAQDDDACLWNGKTHAARVATLYAQMWFYAQCWPHRPECTLCYVHVHERYEVAITPDGAVWVRNRQALMII